ncbi:hypothetical protein HMPREF9436_00486 [Faecalibacterium cf. prausnitzii KLE1255]|uniref:Uncharacterized protein n=1 Tax=Faecalibacterium cf. prausnitzii KLE1255 TaxID=748224 RepID=E2ZFQ3_9FIRM|nr:hypothetical protein HMPREF9436_00486 [Faecalibacterium cf. prausnitzii KLE1255]
MQKYIKVKRLQNFGWKIVTLQKRFGQKLCYMTKIYPKQAKNLKNIDLAHKTC